jgi:hypothetical protein
MFHYQLVIWECNNIYWHETSLSTVRTNVIPSTVELKISPWNRGCVIPDFPDIEQYVFFVQDYTRRKLTYPSDGLQAITGLLSLISPSFSGQFISGLPEMFFNEALLWQPRETMQRRQASGQGESPPSWSWAGWEGDIMKDEWLSHYDYVTPAHQTRKGGFKEPKTMRPVTPLVDWYHGNTRDDNHPITPYSFDSTRSSLPPISARYISCRTKRAFFKGQPTSNAREDVAARYGIVLKDGRNKVYGSINIDLLGGVRQDIRNLDYTDYELVAISQGSCIYTSGLVKPSQYYEGIAVMGWGNFDDHEDKEDEYSKHGHLVEFYYVLWVEWVDGIAYRKGLGRILKKNWEEEDREEINLILG